MTNITSDGFVIAAKVRINIKRGSERNNSTNRIKRKSSGMNILFTFIFFSFDSMIIGDNITTIKQIKANNDEITFRIVFSEL